MNYGLLLGINNVLNHNLACYRSVLFVKGDRCKVCGLYRFMRRPGTAQRWEMQGEVTGNTTKSETLQHRLVRGPPSLLTTSF